MLYCILLNRRVLSTILCYIVVFIVTGDRQAGRQVGIDTYRIRYCRAPQARREGPPGNRRQLSDGKPRKLKCLVIYTKPLPIIFLFKGSIEH